MTPNNSPDQPAAVEHLASDKPAPQQSVLKPFTKKNWDAIIDEFEKEEEKDQGVNELFKQIYESGNDDVRRAMNKSFQESGGTVLSTNWSNVAEKRVEPKPPSSNDDKPADIL